MALTTVYFNEPTSAEIPYTKAIVEESRVKFFEDLGASRSVPVMAAEIEVPEIPETPDGDGEEGSEEDEEEDEEEDDSHPDKGFGEPGSLKWHRNSIDQMRTKKEVLSYVKEVTGKEIEPPKKATLGDIKSKAFYLIKEEKENNG